MIPDVHGMTEQIGSTSRSTAEASRLAGAFAGNRLHACVIVLAGILAYWNSLSGELFLDDQSAILLNRTIRQLWPLVEPLSPPVNTAVSGRPIVNLSFAINYAIGGLSVRGYHIGNISFHILSALVLFGIVRLTLTGPKLRERYAPAAAHIALACSLVWMLHPLQTEAVDYLVQRTELMMALFYFLTLYCAIRAARSHVPDRWHAASVVCCLLGMGCKESMVTAPIVVALYDRVFLFNSTKEALRARKTLYLGLATSWLELLALTTSRNNTVGFSTGVSAWTYLLNQADLIVRYLRLTVWPDSLVLDYGPPRPLQLTDVLPEGVVVVALLVATAIALACRPMFGFLGAWFFVTLSPTSSIVPIASEAGAERRMYLPLAAMALLFVIGGRLLLEWLAGSRFVRGRSKLLELKLAIAAITVVVTAAGLAWGTVRRNADYASPVSILRTTVDRWPHGRAHLNLAVALKSRGDRDEALKHLIEAVPDNPEARYLLGSELYDRGRYDEAIVQLREFMREGPSRSNVVAARNLIGLSLASLGKLLEAAEEFRTALNLEPRSADLHGNLAYVLLGSRDFEGAIRHYQEHLSYLPDNPFALTNLGIALAATGRQQEALDYFRRALTIDPRYAPARSQLAIVQRQNVP